MRLFLLIRSSYHMHILNAICLQVEFCSINRNSGYLSGNNRSKVASQWDCKVSIPAVQLQHIPWFCSWSLIQVDAVIFSTDDLAQWLLCYA